ncbi:hypothetical protein B566_EDAN007389 [Ephemera danica]|nr:hypothetical protein B566_EDAN007389 [Ephemera danica]
MFQVHWVQQQHAKRRVKRDFSAFGSDFPTLFGLDHSAPALAPSRAALSLHPTHRQQYRGAGPFFPDPLFKEQWYMNGGAKDGFDMNVWPAWQKGYTGQGVVVSILDDGIQTNHPDLAGNYVSTSQ